MKIETYIDSLVSYAMNTHLAEPEDQQVLLNHVLELLEKPDYEPSDEPQFEDLEEILNGLLDYAVEVGTCADDSTSRDLFDTKLMGILTPMPREIRKTFAKLYAESPEKATDWYYKLSQDTDYIRRYRIAKDMHWKTKTQYAEILKEEVGQVFAKVLEHAGVYKCTEEGKAALPRFVAYVN